MRKGFTVIELLVLVTIILLIVFFAVPRLIRMRLQQNEADALKAVKLIAKAQQIWQENNYSKLVDQKVEKGYAKDLSILYRQKVEAGDKTSEIKLIPESLAKATTKDSAGYRGYYFVFDKSSKDDEFKVWGKPIKYGESGKKVFYTNHLLSRGDKIIVKYTDFNEDIGDALPEPDAKWIEE